MLWNSNIGSGKRLFSPHKCPDRDKVYLLSCRYGISHIVSVKTKYSSCSIALLMRQEQCLKYHAPHKTRRASLHLTMIHAVGFLAFVIRLTNSHTRLLWFGVYTPYWFLLQWPFSGPIKKKTLETGTFNNISVIGGAYKMNFVTCHTL